MENKLSRPSLASMILHFNGQNINEKAKCESQ